MCFCSIAKISPFLLHLSLLAKCFMGAAVSLVAENSLTLFCPGARFGWAAAPQQGCRGPVACGADVHEEWM